MNHRLNVTPGAISDLEDFRAFAAASSEAAAERLMDHLEKAITGLAFMPNRHSLAPEAQSHKRQIRQVVSGKYRILFWITTDIVHVLRVRHLARQPFPPGELS